MRQIAARTLGVFLAVLFAFLGFPAAGAGQQAKEPAPVPSAHLTHEQALADTRTFLGLLQATHPDPYTNLGGKIAFERRAETLIDELPAAGLTVGDLAARLGTFVAPLHDGHTNVTLYNATWRAPKKPLPIRVQITADTFFVAASDLPSWRGTRGAKIIGVNGHATSALEHTLAARFGQENAYGLDRVMAGVLQSEDLLANLIPDLAQQGGATYNLETPNGRREDRYVPFGGSHTADPETWLEKPLHWSGMDRSDDLFYFRFLDSGRTAYLRVASMGGREAVETYRRMNLGGPGTLHEILVEYYQLLGAPLPANIDSAIAGIPSLLEIGTRLLTEMRRRHTPNLIIDLRGNGGGMTGVLYPFLYQLYGDDYFAYQFPDSSVTVLSPLYIQFFSVDTAKERTRNGNFEVGWYRFNGDGDDDSAAALPGLPGSAEWARARRVRALAEWRARGYTDSIMTRLDALDGKSWYRPRRVVVLVDPATFSAGFQIEFYLKGLGATLVGVPVGAVA